jgi:hypothetical protein
MKGFAAMSHLNRSSVVGRQFQTQVASPRTGEHIARLVDWRPVADNPSLLGRATVVFSGGWGAPGIPVFRRADGSLSVGPPSYPIVGQDGVQQRDDAGKRQYTAALFFADAAARKRWNDLVLAALADAGIGGAP